MRSELRDALIRAQVEGDAPALARVREEILGEVGGVVHHVHSAPRIGAQPAACGEPAMADRPGAAPFYVVVASVRGAAGDVAASHDWEQVTCPACLAANL